MIKTILIDADGVLLKPRDKFFSQRLVEDKYCDDPGKIKEFFVKEYKDISLGKADLKERVAKYLESWGWGGTVEELLEYWFSYENEINQEVLQWVDARRNEGYKVYIVSDHSRYRGRDVMENVGLKKYVDGGFFSGDIGYTKEDPEFFKIILDQLNLNTDEILFIDDDPENIDIAEKIGLQTQLFTGVENLKLE